VVSSTSSLKSVSNCCFCCEFVSHSGCYRSNGEAGDEAAAVAGIPYTAAIVLGGAASSNDNPQLVPHQPGHQSSCYCCWHFWVIIFLPSDLLLPITCLLTGNGDGGGSGILQFLRFRVLAWNWVEVFRESFPIPCCRKPEKLLDVKAVLQDNIPVIRRFSGGGTVIVDTDTVFVTLICRRDAVTLPDLYPRPIMEWTEHLYLPAFQTVPKFHLLEHDYVLGDKKFGGNAQSIIKDRFLHHTSFLWDYQDFRMAYLKLPERAPTYRLVSFFCFFALTSFHSLN
jgi:hypothetical protein